MSRLNNNLKKLGINVNEARAIQHSLSNAQQSNQSRLVRNLQKLGINVNEALAAARAVQRQRSTAGPSSSRPRSNAGSSSRQSRQRINYNLAIARSLQNINNGKVPVYNTLNNNNINKYKVVNAGGGGDCFYLSLRLAARLSDDVQTMRNKIANRILSNWTQTKTINNRNIKTYRYGNRFEYAERIRGKCWAGEDEIEAASQVYKRNIFIITNYNNVRKFPSEQNHPNWPRVYIRANAKIVYNKDNVNRKNTLLKVRMSHFQAYIRK